MDFLNVVLRSRARMVHYQTPALGRLVVNIGGLHKRVNRALAGHDVYTLKHRVHGTAHGVYPADGFRLHVDRAFVRKDRFERSPDGTRTDDPWAARVYADDSVIIRPTGHEFLDVGRLQRFIEGRFNLVGCATQGGD